MIFNVKYLQHLVLKIYEYQLVYAGAAKQTTLFVKRLSIIHTGCTMLSFYLFFKLSKYCVVDIKQVVIV